MTPVELRRIVRLLHDYRSLRGLINNKLGQFNVTWGMLQEVMPRDCDYVALGQSYFNQAAELIIAKYLPPRTVLMSPDGEAFTLQDLCRQFHRLRKTKKTIMRKLSEALTDV